jgi:histone-lysine N-methyltransferase SETMAR
MQYSLIRKVQSFKFMSQKVVLSLESFTEKVFLLSLLISIRNADRAPVPAALNYSCHHNALAHKSATEQEYLTESGLDVLDHPPYSPDLSTFDFWLFPRLKEMLAGHRFESRCGKGRGVPGGVPEMGRPV